MLASIACCARPDEAQPKQKAPKADGILELLEPRAANTTSAGHGPMAALESLDLSALSESAMAEWLETARLDAILGSCRLSLKSVKSGVRCFMAFAGKCSMKALRE